MGVWRSKNGVKTRHLGAQIPSYLIGIWGLDRAKKFNLSLTKVWAKMCPPGDIFDQGTQKRGSGKIGSQMQFWGSETGF